MKECPSDWVWVWIWSLSKNITCKTLAYWCRIKTVYKWTDANWTATMHRITRLQIPLTSHWDISTALPLQNAVLAVRSAISFPNTQTWLGTHTSKLKEWVKIKRVKNCDTKTKIAHKNRYVCAGNLKHIAQVPQKPHLSHHRDSWTRHILRD